MPSIFTALGERDADDRRAPPRSRGKSLPPLKKDELRRLLELVAGPERDDLAAQRLYQQVVTDPDGIANVLRDLIAGRARSKGRQENVFRREGDYWTITYESRVVRLRDAKGMQYLARLMRHPGRAIHVTELVGSRDNGDPAALERARLSVTKAIKSALERIGAAHPALGAHLSVTVRRGYACSYRPDPRHPITWAG